MADAAARAIKPIISALPDSLVRILINPVHMDAVAGPVTTVVARIFKNRVLNKEPITSAAHHLRKGNELCKGRMIPMSPQLIYTVKFIYRKCQPDLQKKDTTPVMEASFLGLADMVWGFIQCSIETETNLHTHKRSAYPLGFLWLRNRRGNTALDLAISMKRVEVAKILLSNASYEDLESAGNSKGKILHYDHIYDGFIFDMLEKHTSRALGLPISMPIHHQQESVVLFHAHREMSTVIDQRQENLEKLDHGLRLGLNPNKNTLLHVVSEFGDVNYVKGILENQPSQISCHNSEGETPVYVAAREGHVDVLEIMLHHLKRNNKNIEQHLIRSKDRHNALHIAIQNHHPLVVFWLLKEIPQLANHENAVKESPLYLAAERNYFEIVKLILKNCREKTFTGPNCKTALHAATISNSAECVKYLLDERRDLLYEKDENDWTPLRYAVHYNSTLAMKELLNLDHSIGYQVVTQDNTKTSALHIAASRGLCETMKVLMSICLGSSSFIDSKGRNILHVAIESKQTEVIEFIFQDESLTSLINQKDNNGNTPAHLLAESNFEMMQKVIDSRVNIHSLNNENRTPLDMMDSDEKRERLIKAIAMGTNMSKNISSSSPNVSTDNLFEKESEGKRKKSDAHFKMVDNLVLVVTLIATATFAAAFTMPGGFDSENGSKQGTPYLLRKAAFQAFVITNAIAFSCSCSVLLAHIVLLIYRNRYDEAGEVEQKYIDDRIVIMYFLTGVALLAMLIAFVTGLYVVLLPSLGWQFLYVL